MPTVLDKVLATNKVDRSHNYRPLETVRFILSRLPQREADIIARRHGLVKGDKETLEEIGQSYQLTRERIRQIETAAIERLKGLSEVVEALGEVVGNMEATLDNHGRIMEEKHFLDELHRYDGKHDPLARQASLFLASELLDDRLEEVPSSVQTRKGWRHKLASWDLFEQSVKEAKQIVEKHGQPLTMDDLLAKINQTEFYKKNKEQLADEHIKAYLRLSQELHHNTFEEWGLSHWPTIKPRRMADKIFLVLKKEHQPLHFQDITKRINEAGFSGKQAYAATVHNELILDDRFVLVGRGIYALKEWGYKKGIVADIIKDVLTAAGKPLTKDQIITEVLKQRLVKPATVNLALMNKKRFKKVGPKTYTVI